jgi:hypothetical protein
MLGQGGMIALSLNWRRDVTIDNKTSPFPRHRTHAVLLTQPSVRRGSASGAAAGSRLE